MIKPTVLIYLNNSVAFSIYNVLKIFFKRGGANQCNSILFINTGQIGDLVVSSLILDNDDNFNTSKIHMLIKEQYLELFKDYNGKVKIVGYNYLKYKWSLIYKIKYIKFLHSLKLNKCYNVTSARGILNDEMSLLSGAREVYCLNSNWRYLKKAFGKRMDREYDGVLCKDKTNEYDKHIALLNYWIQGKGININTKNIKVFKTSRSFKLFSNERLNDDEYITVAPLPSDIRRSWGINNFKDLCKELTKSFKVVLLGSKNDKEILDEISKSNNKIINTAGLLKLYEVPSIISKSKLFVGNDSGLTHIALKFNVPVIAIIGGGNYGKFFPYDRKNPKVIYLYDKMDCFGCEWRCIYNERFCITNVKLNTVLDCVRKLV